MKYKIADYLLPFSCIGPSCIDHCCSDWQIDIDQKQYEWYQTIQEAPLCNILQTALKRNKEKSSFYQYGIIQFNEKNECPCLTNDRLCQIHLTYGEQALSYTCKTYPRHQRKVNDEIFETAYLSCPEITKFVLLSSTLPTWKTISKKAETTLILQANKNVYKKIQETVLQIIQDRTFLLPIRLLFIGIWIEVCYITIKKGKGIQKAYKEAERVLNTYKKNRKSFNRLPSLQMWIPILMKIEQSLDKNRRSDQRLLECLSHWKEGLQITSIPFKDLQIRQAFKKGYQQYSLFFEKHPHILENFCVYSFQQHVFPYNIDTIIINYMRCILEFSMLNHIMIGLANSKIGLDETIILQLFQSYSKKFHHNPNYEQFHLDIQTHMQNEYPNHIQFLSMLLGIKIHR